MVVCKLYCLLESGTSLQSDLGLEMRESERERERERDKDSEKETR